MGLRTGIHTTGVQHISSLAKSDDDIAKFVPNWDGHRVAVESTSVWLMKHLEAEVDIEAMFDQIKKGKIEGMNNECVMVELQLETQFNEITITEYKCFLAHSSLK